MYTYITICSIQTACTGNEATGELMVELALDDSGKLEQIALPVCKDCWEKVEAKRLDSNSGPVIE